MANCIVCGKELTGKQRKYCSHSCNQYDYYHRTHKRPKANCIVCGKELTGKQKKYCSSRCSRKAFYKRNYESVLAAAKKRAQEHPEEIKAYHHDYYYRNKERFQECAKKYYRERQEYLRLPTCKDCLYYKDCGGKKTDCEFRI